MGYVDEIDYERDCPHCKKEVTVRLQFKGDGISSVEVIKQ